MRKFERMKQVVKKNRILKGLYFRTLGFMFALHPIIPMSITIKLYYIVSMGKTFSYSNPQNFNEKLQWLKVFYRDENYSICADKYEVRNYISSQGFAHILNELLGVFDSIDEVDPNKLPETYVIKGTRDRVYIHDKNDNKSFPEIKEIVKKWGKQHVGLSTGEFHYLAIHPKIIIEKYLGEDDGTLPVDYKIYCFNGKPSILCVYADRNRMTGETKRCYFDEQWNPINIATERFYTSPDRFDRPKNLDEMWKIAEKLSKPFPFVRVDLYEVNGKVYFGELTFTPTSGLGKAYSNKGNLEMGQQMYLPPKSNLKKRFRSPLFISIFHKY